MVGEPVHDDRALSVAEAAERLGVSTLRVRQFVAEGRLVGLRDNTGRLRVIVPPDGPGPRRHAAEDAAELLLDEILELRHERSEAAVDTARLVALVERQQSLLDSAAATIEAADRRALTHEGQTARALSLLERALAQAEAQRAALARNERAVDDMLKRIDKPAAGEHGDGWRSLFSRLRDFLLPSSSRRTKSDYAQADLER